MSAETLPVEPHPAELLKVLGDSKRLRILMMIQAGGPLCVCEIVAALKLTQPRVSRLLAQLKARDLVTDERRGQWVYYDLNPNNPGWLCTLLNNLRADHAEKVHIDLTQARQTNNSLCK